VAGRGAHLKRPFTIDEHGVCPTHDPEAEPHEIDGTIIITEGGCDFVDVLVVTGDPAGTVWTNQWNPHDGDSFVWRPSATTQPIGFLAWIQIWLDLEASRSGPAAAPGEALRAVKP
jgi:hypothetical protein